MNGAGRRAPISIWIIFALALFIRWTDIVWTVEKSGFPAEYGAETSQIAESIVEHRGFSSPYRYVRTGSTAFMAPAYPYLLATIYKIGGIRTHTSFIIATLLNGSLSALTCFPIFWIGQRLGKVQVGRLSALAWALFPTSIQITREWVWDVALLTLLLALIVWAAIELREKERSLWKWAGFGALLGVTMLVNPTVFSVYPFLFLWLGGPMHRTGLRRLRALGTAAVVLCSIWAAWPIRNYTLFHRFIPFRSNFGLELWLGNPPEGADLAPNFYTPYSNLTENKEFARVGEIAYMEAKEALAKKTILAHPLGTVNRFAERFAATWIGIGIPIAFIGNQLDWPVLYLHFYNDLVVVLALAGLYLLSHRKNELLFPLGSVILFFPIVYYVTHTGFRYRHPADPVLMVLASFAAVTLFSWVLNRSEAHAREPEIRPTEAQLAS